MKPPLTCRLWHWQGNNGHFCLDGTTFLCLNIVEEKSFRFYVTTTSAELCLLAPVTVAMAFCQDHNGVGNLQVAVSLRRSSCVHIVYCVITLFTDLKVACYLVLRSRGEIDQFHVWAKTLVKEFTKTMFDSELILDDILCKILSRPVSVTMTPFQDHLRG